MAPPDEPRSATIRRRKNRRSLRRRDGLVRHARDNTSQNGEDGIIARLFDKLLPPTSPRRHCVDVGAWDGKHLSNTYSLLVEDDRHGDADDADGRAKWNGVLIEADPERFEELKILHDPLGNACIRAEVSCAPASPRSLTSILERYAPDLPRDFDFLSIDVDGADYWILCDALGSPGVCGDDDEDHGRNDAARSRGYRPKVICVEFNPTMPSDLVYVQPRDDGVRHGSSLSAMVELANAAGYTLVETTLFNAFFVQTQLYEQYLTQEVPDTSIEALHELSMGTELYQLYDGTIKLWGCKKMLWHRLPMDEGRMQVLPTEERSFPFAPTAAGREVSMNGGSEGRRRERDPPKAANTCDAQLKSERIREMAIDMSPYCCTSDKPNDGQTTDDRRECFTKLNRALRTDGFALVRGIGISRRLCDNALRAARAFLHEADEPVRRSCLTKDRARRGYSPMCTENFASLVGKQGPNDLVKKYRLGPDSNSNDGEQGASMHSSLHQPNAWPTDEIWGHDNASTFRSSVGEYYEITCLAADFVLKAICNGVIDQNSDMSESIKVLSESTRTGSDADADDYVSKKNHTSILTLLGYQPGSRHKRGSRGYMRPLVSAHTDVGVVTVLYFDHGKCASLQRATDATNADPEKDEWKDVDLPDIDGEDDYPVFVVNVGDCLSELSGGSLRSTLHRVVPRPCPDAAWGEDAARTCLALFVVFEPSASLILPSGEVVSHEEWRRRRRIARATAVLKNR